MSKKIVFCADGTWNHPKESGKVSTGDTNVYKLYKALLTTATQSPHYDDGVGADTSFFQHLLDGAFGEGLFKKIRDGYTTVAHDYADGDSIYLFGFSRGAYTARSIGGMLAACGLPKTLSQSAIDDAFAAYRMPPESSQRAAAKANLVAKYGNRPVTIAMVGVWDTVGSLGVPSLIGGVDPVKYGFLDTRLSGSVKAAFHAISIDEQRKAFPPTLWVSDDVPGQILEQVWFSGCHSNVGGGCDDSGLSDITLKWMLTKAKDQGLEIDPTAWTKYQAIDAQANGLDAITESWSLLWGIPEHRVVPSDAMVADSVGRRLQQLASYAPPNLTLTSAQPRGLCASYSVVKM
jgi:uncharacterized protein (DUF2235 family)